MQRVKQTSRAGWQETVASQGLIYHTPDGNKYWDESACYVFRAAQIDELERATNELQARCLDAVQFVIDRDRFADLGIPKQAVPAILKSWEEEPPAVYGRFDLSYDGRSVPKLLEYNADTPTALLEAAVIQWYWLRDIRPDGDQFNSIHERLIAKWKELVNYIPTRPLYFVHADAAEDMMTVTYLRDTAEQAGIATAALLMPEVGWNAPRNCFVDLQENAMCAIFKLYPWEWMLNEPFGQNALATYGRGPAVPVQWIEPIWKMVLSNKGIMAILWEMFPGHPHLLETYLDKPRGLTEYVKKPKLSREGANVTLHSTRESAATEGDYGQEGFVYQAAALLPDFEGNRPVVGSWVIDGASAGIGIRESSGPITDNLSRFVPHMFLP